MVPLALIGSLGLPELLLLLLIVLVLFGARRIPEIARGVGEGIRGFRSALRGDEQEPKSSARRDEGPKSPS